MATPPMQIQPRDDSSPSLRRSASVRSSTSSLPTRKASTTLHNRSSSSLLSPADVKELRSQQRYDSPFDTSLAVARKRSQQEKLWEIFASYALQLSCEDPTRMRVANVIKLLQDCGVIDGSQSEESKLIEKEVLIVCEAFLKSHPTDRDGTKKLNFTAFLALLTHFAKMSGDQDPNRAYDSLARTCIEKQPKARYD